MTTKQTVEQLIDLSDNQTIDNKTYKSSVVHDLLDMDFSVDDHTQSTHLPNTLEEQPSDEEHQSDEEDEVSTREKEAATPIDNVTKDSIEHDSSRRKGEFEEEIDQVFDDFEKEQQQHDKVEEDSQGFDDFEENNQGEREDKEFDDFEENKGFDDVEHNNQGKQENDNFKENKAFDDFEQENTSEQDHQVVDEFDQENQEEQGNREFDEFDKGFEDFEENKGFDDFEQDTRGFDDFEESKGFDNFDQENQGEQEGKELDDFQEKNQGFDDFDDFDDDGFVDGDDGFDDFDDFEAPVPAPRTPTEADVYVDILNNHPEQLSSFLQGHLDRIWHKDQGPFSQQIGSPVQQNEHPHDILLTPCSQDLWNKLSHETAFYNPMTGAVGQFQWIRSETNKAYLNALGVTFNHDDRSKVAAKKKPISQPIHTTKQASSPSIVSSQPASPDSQTNQRPASTSPGLRVMTEKMDEGAKEAKKEADQEMELDIDIARAYCELTEETIRIFPDVKLNAMVTELSRLQRQAADYLDHLLDQKEQLKMDAETYNDLISCIVGHAQRLHVNSKDASPAMVSKKKKTNSGTFTNMMRRKTTTNNSVQSASMSGGVVGMKQQASSQQTPRRSM